MHVNVGLRACIPPLIEEWFEFVDGAADRIGRCEKTRALNSFPFPRPRWDKHNRAGIVVVKLAAKHLHAEHLLLSTPWHGGTRRVSQGKLSSVMRKILVVVFLVLSTGCGAYFTNAGKNAGTGLAQGLESDESKKKLSDMATEATKASRDELLGQTTDDDIKKLIKDAGDQTRAELDTLITATLQNKLRETIRMAVNEFFSGHTMGEVDDLREHVVGPPLQKDIDDLIDHAMPHLTTALTKAVQDSLQPIKVETSSLKSQADEEAQKWKPIAIGFGIGAVALLIAVLFMGHTLRHHRRLIEKLADKI